MKHSQSIEVRPASDASPTSALPHVSPIYFAAIFAWTMAAVSALMMAIVRWPLASPHGFVFAKAFLLPGAVIGCATLLCVRHVERGGRYGAVLISAIGLIFLPCLAWFNGLLADVVIYPLFVGLFVAGVWQVGSAVRAGGATNWMFAIASGGIVGFGYFLVINSRAFGSILTPELALTGIHQLDTIFHAAIANMLVKYGVLTTGLDGLLPTKYHVLSHIWLGCVSLWLGVTTLEGYSVGGQIIGIPMLIFSLSLAIHLFRRRGEGFTSGALMTLCPLLLLFLADLWGVTAYLVSESYFLAMIIFLLTLPLLSEIADPERGARLGVQIVILGIAGLLILLSKISVGAVLAAGIGILMWRRMGMTPSGLIKLGVPLLLLVIVAIGVFSPGGRMLWESLEPFAFVREYARGAWPNIVAILLLVCAAVHVWRNGAVRDKAVSEAAVFIAIGALLPALLINVPGGSTYYFLNVATWTAIVFICAYCGPGFEKFFPHALAPATVLAALLLVAFVTEEKRTSAYRLGAEFAQLQARIRKVNGEPPIADTTTRQRLTELLTPGHPSRYALAADVSRTPGAKVIDTLTGLGVLPARRAAVFVPPDNLAFWNLAIECRQDPLFVPAILGLPMLRGLNPPAVKCPSEPYYGFAYYKDAASEPMTDEQLCARAGQWKLETVFVLETLATGRKVACK